MRILATVLVVLWALVAPGVAQDAKVLVLDQADAVEAKALYAQKLNIETKLAVLNAKIRTKYTEVKHEGKVPQVSGNFALYSFTVYKDGWSDGFRFSEDYKYIVPVELNLQASRPNSCYYGINSSNSSTLERQ